MSDRMMGLETEFAFAAFGTRGERFDQDRALTGLMELVRTRTKFLPGKSSSGIFLENGSRLYIDCKKPELATPECTNPWDVCRYQLAGTRMLAETTAALVQSTGDMRDAVLSTINVSYTGSAATWAGHESYGHRGDPQRMPLIIPHLVSRIIYTGAGGFDNKSPGLVFLISPRVAHLFSDVSEQSTRNRGIFHTKDESLSQDGFHRLHVISGETVCSETALWLKVATTALVTALIEARQLDQRPLDLASPVAAMREYSQDESLSASATLANGDQLTALELQRRILEQVFAHRRASFMPEWAPAACEAWAAMLDRLAAGPREVSLSLDWAIKLALFKRHSARRGIEWDVWPLWNRVLTKLHAAVDALPENQGRPIEITEETIYAHGPVGDVVTELTPSLRRDGLSWDDFDRMLQLRKELCEIDLRFGEQSERGIFRALERSGSLRHHVEGVDRIETAMFDPPAVGRAKIRGEAIRSLSGQTGGQCEWNAVWDIRKKQILNLADPFAAEAAWVKIQEPPEPETTRAPPAPRGITVRAREALDNAHRMYAQGQYEQAAEWIKIAEALQAGFDSQDRIDFMLYRSWVQARRGFLDGPELLSQSDTRELTLRVVCDYASMFRYRGLVPTTDLALWIRTGRQLMDEGRQQERGVVAAFLDHAAFSQLAEGDVSDALETLNQAREPQFFDEAPPRIRARILADLGEASRRMRGWAATARYLKQAELIQLEHNFAGDHADLTLTTRAKMLMEDNPKQGRMLLRTARQVQVSSRNLMGETRSLLLDMRMPRPFAGMRMPIWSESALRRVQEIRGRRPALAECRLLGKILANWDAWTSGGMLDDESEYFWGL